MTQESSPDEVTPGADPVTSGLPGPLWSFLGGTRNFLRHGPMGMLGMAIIVAYVLVALLAPYLGIQDPLHVDGNNTLSAPSSAHWFGTDSNGMDVFARVIHAARLDLPICFAAVGISMVVGVLLGLISGYLGGAVDMLLLRTMDVLQAFPAIILGLAVVAASNQSITTLIVVIAFLDTPVYTRMIRDQTLRLRDSMFVEAARCVGNSPWRVMWRHVLPNAFPSVIVQTAIRLSWAMKITAALAFVGVGIQVPTPEWGAMIRQGSAYMVSGEWWVGTFPGLALVVLVFAFNIVADALQDYLDPKKGGR